jgi:F-type H+-transporting ATPase subunit c
MKVLRILSVILAAMFLASVPALAQATAAPAAASSPREWRFALAGIGMAIASGLCGLGQGRAVASASEGIARNPGAVAAIRGVLILGLVLIESLALYTLVVIFVVA